MNLTTRCPSCGTAFRVQPAQLSARGGKVRCGKCSGVFDGVKALVRGRGAGAQRARERALAAARPVRSAEEAAGAATRPTRTRRAGFLDETPRRAGALWALAALLAAGRAAGAGDLFFRAEIAALLPETRRTWRPPARRSDASCACRARPS
jgi:predicted Zn finger-like uncharacterized protein